MVRLMVEQMVERRFEILFEALRCRGSGVAERPGQGGCIEPIDIADDAGILGLPRPVERREIVVEDRIEADGRWLPGR